MIDKIFNYFERYIEKQFTSLPATIEEVERATFREFIPWVAPVFKIGIAVFIISALLHFVPYEPAQQESDETIL